MLDPTYELPPNPQYNTQIRKLQNSDPANANTLFNPLIQAILENIHSLKLRADTANSERFTLDFGLFTDTDPIALHNNSEFVHIKIILDGNATPETAEVATTLEEHLSNPNAHWNLDVDGNNT